MRIGLEVDLELRPACSAWIASGGGTSIQSTWPERSAARRVVGSGIGHEDHPVELGRRAPGPSSPRSWRARALTRGVTLTILNGPVPLGCLAELDPVACRPSRIASG